MPNNLPMKPKFFSLVRRSLLTLMPALVLTLAGCSLFSSPAKKSDVMAQPSTDVNSNPDNVARLHIGDTVTISFSGLPPENTMDPLEKPIKDDGTITLNDIGSVVAAGKTPGELEDAIHDLYVPKFLKHLNVTVKTSSDRVYYVRGEVHQPGRLIYAGNITVSKAITSAGDFTDFASRSNVMLIRSNGDRFKLNINKILDGEQPDPPVYPGDQIVVHRRIF
jgi:protein involved in polysaccharide export with SLBB domain